MLKKIIGTTLALAMTLGVLAGCSSDDRTTLEKIKEEGELSYAMTGAYPPFNFIDEGGELAGFDIEIANAIAKEMGVKAVPITVEWDGLISGLQGDRFDMIIGSMAITDDRLKEVLFSDPYYYDGAQFFAETGSDLTSLEELDNGKVGVVTGTTFHEYLQTVENVGEILQFSSDVDNFLSVEQERSDGLVTGLFVGLLAPERYGVNIEPIGDLLYQEDIAIAMSKDDEDLKVAVNEALQTIVDNGTYEEISMEWFDKNILVTEN